MSKHGKQAEDYIGAGLAVMPVTFDKIPIVTSVNKARSQPLTVAEFIELEAGRPIRGGAIRVAGDNIGTEEAPIWETRIAGGIGILTGAVSGGLEAIDVDTKYDLTGTLWADLSKAIQTELPDLWPLLTIAETRSGGRHILYRCETIKGNDEIAKRPKDNGTGSHAVIETRGEGGYLVAAPTEGYKLTQGSYLTIPTITPEQRAVLWAISKDFDQMPQAEEPTPQRPRQARPDGSPKTPLEDFNERGDVLGLLTARGWKVVRRSGQKTYLLRSGNPSSGVSGNFHEGHRKLYLFSTSTEFEAQKSLSPSDVFIKLEANGDTSEAARKLRAMGYGDPYKPTMNRQTERAVPMLANVATPQPNLPNLEEVGISVNIVNRVTGETTPVPDLTLLDAFRDVAGEVVVTGNGDSSQALRAGRATRRLGRGIYIEEDGSLYALWEFALRAVIERHSGQLDAIEKDDFLRDVVKTGLELEPLDRDRYLKAFTDWEAVKESGVKLETLQTIAEKLETTKAKEKQRDAVKGLLWKAENQTEEGKVSEAIDTLTEGLNEARAISKEADLQRLLIRTTEADVRAKLQKVAEGIPTGYKVQREGWGRDREEEELILPAGALSVFAAPTSHGKTAMLINLALRAVEGRPVVFFSYEESGEAVLLKTLNTYTGEPISGEKNNRRAIFSYFKGEGITWIKTEKREHFEKSRKAFFSELVETGRLAIHYSDLSAEELCDAIRYLHKEDKVGAVFIDYFQLLSLKDEKGKLSRQEQLKQICLLLKAVAVDTGLPIILGAQFTREVTNPFKMHPTRIGEAGDIERIVALLVGMWNTNFELTTSGANKASQDEIDRWNARHDIRGGGQLFLKVLKYRDGEVNKEAVLDFKGNEGVIKMADPLTDEDMPFNIPEAGGSGLVAVPPQKRKIKTQRTKKKSGVSEVVTLVEYPPVPRKPKKP
jgi:hypothetical protein